ncbi:hypothetical protein MKX70_29615 [Paenibacillus sp. FSL R7-0312]|uniref:hypothetical protein n=1 Tax=Paenibacillus sp. FSL R7-0312 TaxID=2921682 RepID=UPI0004F5F3BB|nr:hypothetical protein R50912_09945 [Paenibacillus sp. FSL R5-0912]
MAHLNYSREIERSIDYFEQLLRENLTAEEIAEIALEYISRPPAAQCQRRMKVRLEGYMKPLSR